MAKNSFIFNFENAVLRYPALLLAFGIFIAVQLVCLTVSDITQEGSKQVDKEKRRWARIKGAFQKEPGKELVLVFGNSKIGSGFVPAVFDEVNGGKTQSYNMALIALQLAPHYFMLKEYLKFNPAPDWILLQYSPGGFQVESFPSYAVQGAKFWEVANYTYHRRNWDVFFNYLFPSRLHWPESTRYVVGKTLKLMPAKIQQIYKRIYMGRSDANAIYGHNRTHFYESQYVHPEEYRSTLLRDLRANRGYYFISEQSAEGGVISREYISRVGAHVGGDAIMDQINKVLSVDHVTQNDGGSKAFEPYVEDFFKLTRAYNIKVMVISDYELSPDGIQPLSFDKRVVVPGELRRLAAIYPNIHFIREKKGPILLGYESFSDPGHVNYHGAELYTRIVAEEFKDSR